MFGKPKVKTAEELLRLLDELPEEEKNKVLSAISKPEEKPEDAQPSAPAEAPAEDPAEAAPAEDAPAEEGSETLDAVVGQHADEPAQESAEEPAQEPAESTEAPAEDPAETPTEAQEQAPDAEVKNDEQDRFEALAARILALEEQLAAMKEAHMDAEAAEADKDFGSAPSAPKGPANEDRMSAVMRNYAGDKAKNYM